MICWRRLWHSSVNSHRETLTDTQLHCPPMTSAETVTISRLVFPPLCCVKICKGKYFSKIMKIYSIPSMDGFHTDAFKATKKIVFWVIFLQKPTKVFQKTEYKKRNVSFFPPKKETFFRKNFLINFALIQHQKSSNWYIINGENISI